MNIRKFLFTVAATLASMAAMAQTDGFSYQAIVRDANGELVTNKKIGVRLTLTADQKGRKVKYCETHTDVPINNYGALNVIVGTGKADAGYKFGNINWSSDTWMQIEVDIDNGTNYTNLGATKLQAVPVALYAVSSGSKPAGSTSTGDALFDVKDNDGNVVFAVYPDGVCVYVNEDDSKAKRSGLIVTGRKATKDAEPQDYLIVNPTGTQVFVDETDSKAKRSGLIVTGRKATKDAEPQDYLIVNPDGTQVIVDESDDKAKRSGLIVTGRKATKDDGCLFAVDNNGTVGDNTAALGLYASATGEAATAMGLGATATGNYSTALGSRSESKGEGSFAAGSNCVAGSLGSVALGYQSQATGASALALGEEAEALGHGSCAIGILAKAKGEASYAIGQGCEADSVGAVAMGYNTKAIGKWCFSFGNCSEALEDGAVALGKSATAKGLTSFATGESSLAQGSASVAFGFMTQALGHYSVAIGPQNVSFGQEAVTLGKWLYARTLGETVVGSANDTLNYGSDYFGEPVSNLDDRLFTIGNGSGEYSRSNAMVVLKNGNIGIGTSTPKYLLEVNGTIKANNVSETSDLRLKRDVTTLNNSLQKVLQLRGVNYYWKSEDEIKTALGTHEKCQYPETLQIGVVAQEVEEVVPEVVETDAKGFKSVDYTKLVPVLIEAIKEQQKEIDELKRMVESLQNN